MSDIIEVPKSFSISMMHSVDKRMGMFMDTIKIYADEYIKEGLQFGGWKVDNPIYNRETDNEDYNVTLAFIKP